MCAQPEPVITTLVVSGKTPERIAPTAAVLAEWMIGEGADVPLVDVAHTLNHHRTRYKNVATVCARDRAQAVAGSAGVGGGRVGDRCGGGRAGGWPSRAGCLCIRVRVRSGRGWPGSCWPMSRRSLRRSQELEPAFVEQVGFSLRQVLAEGESVSGDARVQPVLMGLQLALTALWRSYGVVPDAVIGHSMGEVTAAVVAGALSVVDGLRVIATRSRLMSTLAGQGAVALLELDADAAQQLIADYPRSVWPAICHRAKAWSLGRWPRSMR